MSRPGTALRNRCKATEPSPGTEQNPRPGRKAGLALELSAGWPDRAERALLVLLAILADERQRTTPAAKLAAAIGVDVPELDRLLSSLALRGLIWTTRRPERINHYTLLFAGERVPCHDRDRHRRWARHHFEREPPRA